MARPLPICRQTPPRTVDCRVNATFSQSTPGRRDAIWPPKTLDHSSADYSLAIFQNRSPELRLSSSAITAMSTPECYLGPRVFPTLGQLLFTYYGSTTNHETTDIVIITQMVATRGHSAETRAQSSQEGARFFARSGNVVRERPEVKYRVIDRCREAYPIRPMCRCLKVSPSGYYGCFWIALIPPLWRRVMHSRLAASQMTGSHQ